MNEEYLNVHIRITEDTAQKLNVIAAEKNVYRKHLIADILDEYVKKYKK